MTAQPVAPPQPPPAGSGQLSAAALAALQLVDANGRARQVLAGQVATSVKTLVSDFNAWYDDAAVRRLGKAIAVVLVPAQRLTASQEDAYLTAMRRLLGVGDARPVGPVDVALLRAGTHTEQVYQRLAERYRWQRSLGNPDPMPGVLDQADAMVLTDLQDAARHQDQRFFTKRSALAYRRVIHPELSAGGTCGLCIAASTRQYKRSDLLPIHDRCNCTVVEVTHGQDVGLELNDKDIGRLYQDAGSTAAADLKRTRYVVDDRGDLKSVLVPERRSSGGQAPRRRPAGVSVDVNDPRQVELRTAVVDTVASVADQSLADAAAQYARAGVPVFPVRPGDKRPLTGRGLLDASTDPQRVANWWRRWPDANIGIPTGPRSGVDVVDVDVAKVAGRAGGHDALDELRAAGLLPAPILTVDTPSGGRHLYYPASGQRNGSLSKVGLDFRGDGGYVLVPPSVNSSDSAYARAASRTAAAASAVDWTAIRDRLSPRRGGVNTEKAAG